MTEEIDPITGEKYMRLSDDETRLGFLAECVERLAEVEGMDYRDMFDRMEQLDLTEGYVLKFYETIHTQSWEHVIEDLQQMLHRNPKTP